MISDGIFMILLGLLAAGIGTTLNPEKRTWKHLVAFSVGMAIYYVARRPTLATAAVAFIGNLVGYLVGLWLFTRTDPAKKDQNT